MLVAFTASGSFGSAHDSQQQPSPSPRASDLRVGAEGSDASDRGQGSQRTGVRTSSGSGSSSSRDVPDSPAWPSAGTDGYQLSLAVAVAACNAITGVSSEGDGMLGSSAAMGLKRPCLQAEAMLEMIQGGDMLEVGPLMTLSSVFILSAHHWQACSIPLPYLLTNVCPWDEDE